MEEKDMKFINIWGNKRKRGGVFVIAFRTIIVSIVSFIFFIIFEYIISGRDYFYSEQFGDKIFVPITIVILISFSGALNEWRRNERRYDILIAAKNRIKDKN